MASASEIPGLSSRVAPSQNSSTFSRTSPNTAVPVSVYQSEVSSSTPETHEIRPGSELRQGKYMLQAKAGLKHETNCTTRPRTEQEPVGVDGSSTTTESPAGLFCEVVNFEDVSTCTSESGSRRASEVLNQVRETLCFKDAGTLRSRQLSNNHVPKIHRELERAFVNGDSAPSANGRIDDEVTAIIEALHKAPNEEQRRHTLQKIQTSMLPMLARKQYFICLARFLTIHDVEIQTTTTSFLQAQLLQLSHREDPSLKDELLAVAERTQMAFCQSSDTDNFTHVLGCLHLYAMSALFTCCPKPSDEECAHLVFSSQNTKKTTLSSNKIMTTKGLCAFYKNFHLDVLSALPVWRKVGWKDDDCLQRKNLFESASVCVQIVLAFTLLNAIAQEGRSDLCWRLLSTLADLRDEVFKNRKKTHGKDKDSVQFIFSLMLVRGLVFLLNTTFREEIVPVGERRRDYAKKVVDLIMDLVQRGNNSLKHETYDLPFHHAPVVRQAFSYLHLADNQPECFLAITYIQKYLRRLGFYLDSNPDNIRVEKQCVWHELVCYLAQKKACLTVLAPKHSCLAEGPMLIHCIQHHLNDAAVDLRSQEWQTLKRAHRLIQNFDLLVELNLRSQSKHIIQLYAYQYFPFPFCITETIQDKRLIQFLLKHRQDRQWLSKRALLKIMTDVVEALDFLKQMHIVQRDITSYNMVVDTDSGQRRPLKDILPSGRFTVKLADLGLAHKFTDPTYQFESTVKVAVEDQGPVPYRWISPEALRYGKYSEKSMVYSLGCVAYELFTHACQPYTSYDRTITTEELLLTILFEPEMVTLHHWVCIPNDIFDLISKCTKVNETERPTLRSVAEEVQHLMEIDTMDDSPVVGMNIVCHLEKNYPPISPSQVERHHKPETGIPASVQICIEDESEAEQYMNTQKKSRQSLKKTEVTSGELIAEDWVEIISLNDKTVIRECVSENFVKNVLPKLEANDLPGIKCWSSFKRTVDTQMHSSTALRLHERHYPPSINLLSAAKSHKLWDTPGSDDTYYDLDTTAVIDAKYMTVFRSLTHKLLVMHEQGFCHCDIRACNILIDRYTGEVMLPRIGRVCHLSSPQAHARATVFEDSLRWMPPEMTIGLDYGWSTCCLASDIFMLGTTFWEVFNIYQVSINDPAANETHFAPLCEVPKDEVPQASKREGCLSQPANCPGWLYDLICQCRHKDHAKRPSCQKVLEILNGKSPVGVQPSYPFWSDPSDPTELTDQMNTRGERAPTLPKRGSRLKKGIISRLQKFFRSSAQSKTNKPHPANDSDNSDGEHQKGACQIIDSDWPQTGYDDEQTSVKKVWESDQVRSLARSRKSQRSVFSSMYSSVSSHVFSEYADEGVPDPDYD